MQVHIIMKLKILMMYKNIAYLINSIQKRRNVYLFTTLYSIDKE